ncbi:hypothetical protein PR202_ga03776 [Eleusine coracana subsp. coracana]|uniref:Uncharacterized protein n=1 Tax=Eleusine coracana subsp. coracana TaxID=191504 RepID=A0AAV5BQ95_ELECO|nr:hypothetical protein PR202_ga03776 [Eleusine coracana subsp. coracana]
MVINEEDGPERRLSKKSVCAGDHRDRMVRPTDQTVRSVWVKRKTERKRALWSPMDLSEASDMSNSWTNRMVRSTDRMVR